MSTPGVNPPVKKYERASSSIPISPPLIAVVPVVVIVWLARITYLPASPRVGAVGFAPIASDGTAATRLMPSTSTKAKVARQIELSFTFMVLSFLRDFNLLKAD
jgi:hypothetical protein